jgi:ABC-type antimicrobial peptide transport system ATPase subunit
MPSAATILPVVLHLIPPYGEGQQTGCLLTSCQAQHAASWPHSINLLFDAQVHEKEPVVCSTPKGGPYTSPCLNSAVMHACIPFSGMQHKNGVF